MTLHPGFAYRLNHLWVNGLDLIFPVSCGGCGKSGVRWCSECQKNLTPVPSPVCDICGSPQETPGICRGCRSIPPRYSILRSCAVYKDPARPALLKLKYRHEKWLGEAMAWSLAVYLDKLEWQADLIIPVPLSNQRLTERGYNQVDLIAHPLARIMNWQYKPGVLRRARHTISQVGMNPGQRKVNVKGAFIAERMGLAGKTCLLVDDVTTTGSTIDSAAGALIDAGAAKVLALTFAKALSSYGLDHEKLSPSHPLLS